MAWTRPTRAGGAVSGGVNCSLRSGTGTAETTPQVSVTLAALTRRAVKKEQLEKESVKCVQNL